MRDIIGKKVASVHATIRPTACISPPLEELEFIIFDDGSLLRFDIVESSRGRVVVGIVEPPPARSGK